jgi:hypothetical protein
MFSFAGGRSGTFCASATFYAIDQYVYSGDIMTKRGLPRVPAAESTDADASGNTVGLF